MLYQARHRRNRYCSESKSEMEVFNSTPAASASNYACQDVVCKCNLECEGQSNWLCSIIATSLGVSASRKPTDWACAQSYPQAIDKRALASRWDIAAVKFAR